MSCPQCGHVFVDSDSARTECRHCGHVLKPVTVAVARTASVRVVEGGHDRTYRTAAEIPSDIRRRLQKAIQGPESDTVIIANREGYEKIFQAIQVLPPHLRRKVMAAIGENAPERPSSHRKYGVWVLAILLPVLVVLLWWVWTR